VLRPGGLFILHIVLRTGLLMYRVTEKNLKLLHTCKSYIYIIARTHTHTHTQARASAHDV
jgi:hypothetical protein